MGEERVFVVFVHGVFSGPQVFDELANHLTEDGSLASISILKYQYSTPRVLLNPVRVIPDLDAIADGLWTFLGLRAPAQDLIYLVGHSQGGLAIQRMLARQLSLGHGFELNRIIGVSLLACPSQGAPIALTLRKTLLGFHPQERQLRPYVAAVSDAHSTVVQRIENARSLSQSTCPIPITSYVGETDGVVPRASARGSFATVHVLPGDHSGILRAPTADSDVVRALRRDILESIERRTTHADSLTTDNTYEQEHRQFADSRRDVSAIPASSPAPTPIPARVTESEEERRMLDELRGAYSDDEICPHCSAKANVYGYDGSDGDSFDWLQCDDCGLFLPFN